MRSKLGIALAAGVLVAGLPGAALAAPPADTEGSVLFYTRDSPEYHAAGERAVEQFAEAYPNVTVEVQYAPTGGGWAPYIDGLINQIAAGNAPDVISMAVEGFRAVETEDLLIDMRAFVDDATLADIAPAMLTHSESAEGELNYYPTNWNPFLIHYNKDMFDEAGLPYPEEGWTWAEFAETAKALTKTDADGNVTQYGYRVPGYTVGLEQWFMSNGTNKLDDTWTGSNVSDPKFAEALAYLRGLIEDGAAPTYSPGVGDQEFAAKQAAMYTAGHWVIPGVLGAGIENAGVVMHPVPNEGDESVAAFGVGGVGVLKDSDNVELAVEFATTFAGDDFQEDLSTMFVSMPASRKWSNTEEYLSYPDNAELFYSVADDDKILSIQSPANFTQVEGIFVRHAENYLTGNTDLESAISEMDSELTAAMERAAR